VQCVYRGNDGPNNANRTATAASVPVELLRRLLNTVNVNMKTAYGITCVEGLCSVL